MSFRSKRTRQTHLSKVKDTPILSVQEEVAEVIRDAVASEDQGANTLHGSCLNDCTTDLAASTQPTYCETNEADDFGSIERNGDKKHTATQPIILGITQSLVSDHHRRRYQRKSSHAQLSDDQAKHGGAFETHAEGGELGSDANGWINDTLLTEPAQGTIVGTNHFRSGQRNSARRQSRTPPPSGSVPADSTKELRHLHRPPTWLQENDGEPAELGFSEAGRSKSSKWNKDIELAEMEIYEPSRDGPFSQRSKPVEWSIDLPFDEMEEVEMRDSKGKRGKKGGRILPRHVWSLRPGVRFVVPFNSSNQPERKGGSVLVKFLEDIVKRSDLCPIGDMTWAKVDTSYKRNIIAVVRGKFILPDRQEINKQILKHVGNRWKSYRHDLKLEFKKPGKTQEEVASIVPRGVFPSQWVKLVQYWFSDKCKEKAHRREPGDVEWFLETHQRKDGTFVDNSSKAFVDTATALIAQRGAASSSRHTVENQVFNELMYSDDEGFNQQPVGYGFGVNRKKLFGSESKSRKRGYLASVLEAGPSSSKKELFRTEERDSFYAPQDFSGDVERLKFAMTAMSESNELMRGQMKMQSQQLRMQSQQLQMQSKQIEGLQTQLQQVTSLVTKLGSRLNNPQPQVDSIPSGFYLEGMNSSSRPYLKVADASPEYGGAESDSTNWDSDQ